MTESIEFSENQDDQTPVNITVSDIILLKNIVEIASTRGAFRASELSQVGQLYDKVNAWCESVAQSAAENSEGSQEPAEENIND